MRHPAGTNLVPEDDWAVSKLPGFGLRQPGLFRELSPEARMPFLSGFTLEGQFQELLVRASCWTVRRSSCKALPNGIVDPRSRERAGSRRGNQRDGMAKEGDELQCPIII